MLGLIPNSSTSVAASKTYEIGLEIFDMIHPPLRAEFGDFSIYLGLNFDAGIAQLAIIVESFGLSVAGAQLYTKCASKNRKLFAHHQGPNAGAQRWILKIGPQVPTPRDRVTPPRRRTYGSIRSMFEATQPR
jgi:hypothetical protein